MLGLLTLVCAAAAQDGASGPATRPSGAAAGRPHIAVIGFESAPATDPRDQWIATATEEVLTWRLRRTPGLIVAPTARLYQARRELREAGHPQTDWPAVVELVGARLVLSGVATGHADSLELALELRGLPGEPRRARLGPGRLFPVLKEATTWVLDALSAPAVDDAGRALILADPAASPSALEYHARALQAARDNRMSDAVYHADQALSFDARYRPALSMLAQVGLRLGGDAYATALRRLRVLGELARQNGDWLDRAEADLLQGLAVMSPTTPEAAIIHFDRGIESFREHDEPYGLLSGLGYKIDALLAWRPAPDASLDEAALRVFAEDKLRQAAALQVEVLGTLERLADAVAELSALNKMALISERLGQHDRALELHRRTLALAQKTRSPRNEASAWMFLAQWYRTQKRWDEAIEAGKRCVELAGDESRAAVRMALADIYRQTTPARPGDALKECETAYQEFQARDDLPRQVACLELLATLREELGQRDKAVAALQEAVDLAHALKLPAEAELKARLDGLRNSKR